MSSANFESLKLSNWLTKQCYQFGFDEPTPVQVNCIPAVLEGRDVIACAKTGCGKTAAFVLPILEDLAKDMFGVHTLVLTPTRELASQIIDQFQLFGRPIRLKSSLIIGGLDRLSQANELVDRPHIVVSTPGRLADLLRTYSSEGFLNSIKFLVLDEADRLFVDTMHDPFEIIFGAIKSSNRQTLLFSATMTDTLERLKQFAFKTNKLEPLMYFEGDDEKHETTNRHLEEKYALIQIKLKDACLVSIIRRYLEENQFSSVLVFVRTCHYCHLMFLLCEKLGLPCVALHSLLDQKSRMRNLAKFRAFEKRMMLATDVAARGLDIPTVDLVVNHSVPFLPKQYIHRVGRTARAGRYGQSITLVSQFEIDRMCRMERKIGKSLTKMELNEAKILEILPEIELIKCEIKMDLEDEDFGACRMLYKREATEEDGEDGRRSKSTVGKKKNRAKRQHVDSKQ